MYLRSENSKSIRVINGENSSGRMKLTRRELEVLEKVILGLTTQEIAERLFVSINTIETHRKNILQKLKATNIVDAVVKAMRIGLIE